MWTFLVLNTFNKHSKNIFQNRLNIKLDAKYITDKEINTINDYKKSNILINSNGEDETYPMLLYKNEWSNDDLIPNNNNNNMTYNIIKNIPINNNSNELLIKELDINKSYYMIPYIINNELKVYKLVDDLNNLYKLVLFDGIRLYKHHFDDSIILDLCLKKRNMHFDSNPDIILNNVYVIKTQYLDNIYFKLKYNYYSNKDNI